MVMRFFRKHFALIIWITIIVFVLGFVILSTVVYIQKNKDIAFKIGNTNYTIREYMNRLERTRDMLAKQKQQIDDKKLRKDILNSMINEAVLTKFGEELNISYSKKDIMSYIENQKYFQRNGVFDYNQYVAVLRENGLTPGMYESQVKTQLLINQLYKYISKAQAVSPLFILDQQRTFAEKYDIKYFTLPLDYFKNQIKINEQDIKTYYSEHLENYFVKPKVKIAYKILPITVTKTDIDNIIKQLNDIRKKILDKKLTFADAAKLYSQGPSSKNGGELGWFDKDTVDPSFAKVAFSLKKGEISKPFKSKFGYHIVLVEDKRKKDGKLEIKARHILIKPEVTEAEKEQVSNQALEIYGKLKKEKLTDLFKDAKVTDFITSDSLPFKEMNDVFDYKKLYTPGYPFLHKENDKSEYIVYQLIDKKKGYYKSIKDIKDELTKKVYIEKVKELLKKDLTNLTKKNANNSKEIIFSANENPISEIFNTTKLKDNEKKKYQAPSKDILTKLSLMKKNDSNFTIFNSSIYCYTLIKKILPSIKTTNLESVKNNYFNTLIVNSTMSDFFQYLRKKYNVIVYKDRIGL